MSNYWNCQSQGSYTVVLWKICVNVLYETKKKKTLGFSFSFRVREGSKEARGKGKRYFHGDSTGDSINNHGSPYNYEWLNIFFVIDETLRSNFVSWIWFRFFEIDSTIVWLEGFERFNNWCHFYLANRICFLLLPNTRL